MPSGVKTYFLQRRTRTGRAIKVTIGRANRITSEQAPEKARELIAAMELGRDRAQELHTAREFQKSKRGETTVAVLFER